MGDLAVKITRYQNWKEKVIPLTALCLLKG